MSKNITIQEGGVGKQFTAEKIRTVLTAGGDTGWIPESDYTLGTKTIKANGTFAAATDGFYGFSAVTVMGVGSVTGKSEDGNEYRVTKDESGNLVNTLMPSSIVVQTLPTKSTYQNGEAIDYTGMVVVAYDGQGNVWTGNGAYPNGVIPNSELTLQEVHADASKSDQPVYTNGNGINAVRVNCNYEAWWHHYTFPRWYDTFEGYVDNRGLGTESGGNLITLLKNNGPGVTYLTKYNGNVYAANESGDRHVNKATYYDDEHSQGWVFTATYAGSAGDGVFVLCSDHGFTLPESTASPVGVSINTLDTVIGGGQDIPVQWVRPDGETLETSFTIHFHA